MEDSKYKYVKIFNSLIFGCFIENFVGLDILLLWSLFFSFFVFEKMLI